ncbi:alpha/beta hydrolase [Secundilactobacillus folii]|nr:alpha/beta fold hydrolase [Secundilactobacillus folii]
MDLPKAFYFQGGPQAVILLHTFSGTPNDVRVLGRSLQKLGYTVLGPMFTGHGTADPKQIFMQGKPEIWWQDTIKALHQLEVDGHQQIAIFGESLGGLFAMKALAEFDEVITGGTIDTPLFEVDKSRVSQRFLKECQNWYTKLQLPEAEINDKMRFLSHHINEMLAAISEYTVPVHDSLAGLTKPVFIAQAEADELLDRSIGQQLADYLAPTAPVTLKRYPGAPHVMTYSEQGRQLAKDIGAFLTQIMPIKA